MVVRALKQVNSGYPAASISELNKFMMQENFRLCEGKMATLVKSGFLVGYNNSLDPRGNFTMQQAATVIWRIYKN
jgi:hypothetical protein